MSLLHLDYTLVYPLRLSFHPRRPHTPYTPRVDRQVYWVLSNAILLVFVGLDNMSEPKSYITNFSKRNDQYWQD